jgi:quinol monooxygenase YgiN
MSQTMDSTTGHAGDTVHQVDRPADATTSPELACRLTRFSAIDDAAARRLPMNCARPRSVITEPGHLTYGVFVDQTDATSLYVVESWASASDAHQHEELVVAGGTVERVVPLLAEELTTLTLRPVTTDDFGGGGTRPAPYPDRQQERCESMSPAGRKVLVTGAGPGMGLAAVKRFSRTRPTAPPRRAALAGPVGMTAARAQRFAITVFEFMAPLADSLFSAGVVSTEKMPASEAIAELFDGVERNELELHGGMTEDVHQVLRQSSDAAVRAVNVATGG